MKESDLKLQYLLTQRELLNSQLVIINYRMRDLTQTIDEYKQRLSEIDKESEEAYQENNAGLT